MTYPFGKTTVVAGQARLVLINSQGEEKKFSLQKPEHRLGRGTDWADLALPDNPNKPDWVVVSRYHALLRKEGEAYRIFDGDGKGKPSSNGLFVNKKRITSHEGFLLEDGIEIEIGQNPQNLVLLAYFSANSAHPFGLPGKHSLVLKDLRQWPIKLGREPSSNSSMVLNSPTVSRLHALISRSPTGGYVLQDQSTNGTFLNGYRLIQPTVLKDGDRIQIGPFSLIFRNETLELFDPGSNIRIDAHQLFRQVKTKDGKEQILLYNTSLAVEPGQLVALVGGSGNGKSTLLKSLLGIANIDRGKIFINGNDLKQHFDLYRSQIGYVPQDDIVHSELTVEEVLTYACKLRLPPENSAAQVITQTLKRVGLESFRNHYVRSLSGGQRKRVSIAVELLADPKLLFLDEPTSGLDPGLEKKLMLLLRDLANQGRTIILVTHATANIKECDRIGFMGRGGRLCYFGSPTEAMQFFDMPSQDLNYFADIYIELESGETSEEIQQRVDRWYCKFLKSQVYRTYIEAVLSPGAEQQSIHPASERTLAQGKPNKAYIGEAKGNKASFWRQFLLFSHRYLLLIWRDGRSLALTLLTAPIGILLIAMTLTKETPLTKIDPPDMAQAPLALRVLFIFTCVSILIGLLNSVQEIVKESSIYARERLVNLGVFPYLASKLFIRSSLAIIQTLLIALAIVVGFESPNSDLMPWGLGLGITTFLTILSTISFGLAISALVKNENQANSSIALIFLPQLILSGVLFKLEGSPRLLSWLMVSRWSMGAYGSLVNVNAMVPEQLPGMDSFTLPFEATPVYAPTWSNIGLNWLMLFIYTVIYFSVSLYIQKRKNVF